MITRSRTISILFALAVLSGCASTNVTQQTPMVSPGLARPNQIWVYDFIADPARVPADSSIGPGLSAPSTPLTAEELETGRRLGAIIAKNLVADIQAMGLTAVQAGPGAAPQVGDGVLRGYLVSVQAGSAGQAFCDWIQRREFGDGYGGGRLCDDGPGLTPTWIKDAQLVRKQDARNYRAGRGRDCDRQSDRTDRRWRDEDLWRGERQQYA